MAVVQTVIPATPFFSPFERPPDPAVLWSVVPRGLRGFAVHNGTLDLKPINDSQSLHITGTLPINYAYVLAEFGLMLTGGNFANWETSVGFNMQKFFQGRDILGQMQWHFPIELTEFTTAMAMGSASKDMLYKGPMWAASDEAGLAWFMNAFNYGAAATIAATVNAYVTFWEFDLEQMRKFPLNSPIPTTSR